jgi:hypothetical protein
MVLAGAVWAPERKVFGVKDVQAKQLHVFEIVNSTLIVCESPLVKDVVEFKVDLIVD